MSATEPRLVGERDLTAALALLRDSRRRWVQRNGDPWAFRQALVTVLVLDEAAALGHGVLEERLRLFDELARDYALELVEGRR